MFPFDGSINSSIPIPSLIGFVQGETTSELITVSSLRIQQFQLGQPEFSVNNVWDRHWRVFSQLFKRKQEFPWFSALSEHQVPPGGRGNIQGQLIGFKGSLKLLDIDPTLAPGDSGITFLMDDGSGFMEVNSQLIPEYWVVLVALSKVFYCYFIFSGIFGRCWAWTETELSSSHNNQTSSHSVRKKCSLFFLWEKKIDS